MDYIANSTTEYRVKRLERKTILLTYLIFGVYFLFSSSNKWAKRLFLAADLLIMADTASDLIKEFRYKINQKP